MSNGVDTFLHIERGESEEADTYCLLLEETEMVINAENGTIVNIT